MSTEAKPLYILIIRLLYCRYRLTSQAPRSVIASPISIDNGVLNSPSDTIVPAIPAISITAMGASICSLLTGLILDRLHAHKH